MSVTFWVTHPTRIVPSPSPPPGSSSCADWLWPPVQPAWPGTTCWPWPRSEGTALTLWWRRGPALPTGWRLPWKRWPQWPPPLLPLPPSPPLGERGSLGGMGRLSSPAPWLVCVSSVLACYWYPHYGRLCPVAIDWTICLLDWNLE